MTTILPAKKYLRRWVHVPRYKASVAKSNLSASNKVLGFRVLTSSRNAVRATQARPMQWKMGTDDCAHFNRLVSLKLSTSFFFFISLAWVLEMHYFDIVHAHAVV